MKERILKVNKKGPLLLFLIEIGYGKNKAKSLLKYENIWVNNTLVKQFDYLLNKGDEVKITNARKIHPPFQILYEDQEFLVIHKVAKLLTVCSHGNERNLYRMAKKYLKEKGTSEKLFVLHRLDKETSGIIVFCKDQKLTEMLQRDWNHFVKSRIYTALVEGNLRDNKGTLVFYIEERGEREVVVTDSNHGKKAITHYRVLKSNSKYSLLELQIDTGRKNQIRVTLAHIGHPIVGDKKYYAKENPIGRVGLVANIFEFVHPVTKKVYHFEIEVPKLFWKTVR